MVRKRGKKFTVWQVKTKDDSLAPIEVRVVEGGGSAKTLFFVEDEAYGLDIKDNDVNALEQKVREQLKTIQLVDWKPCIKLAFSSQYFDSRFDNKGDLDFNIALETAEILVGKQAGKPCWKSPDRYSSQQVNLESLPDEQDDEGCTSYIVDTPENRAHLLEVKKTIGRATESLIKYFANIKQHIKSGQMPQLGFHSEVKRKPAKKKPAKKKRR